MNTLENHPKILIHAYGNAGRADDALGFAFLEMCRPWLSSEFADHVTVSHDFQLNVEHAYTMSEYDIVLFVDATKNDIHEFSFCQVHPVPPVSFTTHMLTPANVLHLCTDLYGRTPDTYLLQIRGYDWRMMEGLSEKAEKNLWSAFHFFQTKIEEWVRHTVA